MLRLTQQNSPDAAKKYYTQSGADYYAEGQEYVGHWGGEGAKMLGLEGKVKQADFNALCDNINPLTGEQLTPRTKDARTVGYDFTWSVPKSVSLLYAMTEDQAILEAFRGAIHDTMHDMESEMKVRVRKDGRNEERTTRNMAYAEFVHFTSRPVDGVPDVQLHAHCFVLNATYDQEEKEWRAGQFRELKRDAPYFQAAFRVRLANRLQDLGLAIERKRDDFEIAGVPETAIRRFSRRTGRIEAEARARGIEDPKEKDRLGGLTREAKDKSLTWKELQREWENRLSPEEKQAIEEVVAQKGTHGREEQRNAAAVEFASRHLFEREAVVAERKLLTEALKHGLGSVSVEGVGKAADRPDLLVKEQDGRRLVTTLDVLVTEDRLAEFARSSRGRFLPLGDPEGPLAREKLNEGQKAAVRHVLGSRDGVILIRGAAGTGKTTLMQEAVERIEEGGHKVVVLAPSAGASRGVLRSEGFKDADTVARFLVDQKKMQQAARGQVVWVDEASLLSNKDMAALFEVAKRVDARVVLVGDRSQHGAVAAGSPLKLLQEQAGLRSVSVTEIMRQDGDYKKAVKLLSEGKTGEGFAELDQLGWVKEVPDDERYLKLAEAYLQAAAEKKADGTQKSALVVSPTHAEGDRITSVIRAELAAQGKLGDLKQQKGKPAKREFVEREFTAWVPLHLTEAQKGEASSYEPADMIQFQQNARGYKKGQRLTAGRGKLPLDQAARFQVYRASKIRLAAGERIRITAGGKTADGKHRLDNGALYTVKGFTREGNIVLDNNWQIGKDFGHIDYGYTVTSHASQGRTVDKVLIGLSSLSLPAADRATLYVSASRGREQAILFTDDKEALAEAVKRDNERLTATEVFRPQKQTGQDWLKQRFQYARRFYANLDLGTARQQGRTASQQKEYTHER